MEIMEIEKEEVQMTIYTLQSLCFKGISIPETVRMSLENLVQWYESANDSKYIHTALVQICALSEMGMMRDSDVELYKKVYEHAEWGEEELWKHHLFITKKIKPNKSQVKALIRKWMPSRNNPMTIAEVVDDILDKVKNCKQGHYYYCYERKNQRKQSDQNGRDIYKLVIESHQSFLLDIKAAKCYTFHR